MPRRAVCAALATVLLTVPLSAAAAPLLDGRVFEGTIGPNGNPDLADRLQFDDGQFWSGICLDCGFAPGPYTARLVEGGIAFSGRLESDSRGQFDYTGLVRDDGRISVDITWQRKRWYWTASRALVFEGQAVERTSDSLRAALETLSVANPDRNPRCARF